ncbi:MAG: SAM-dependent methyltransferase [Halioglobus sp.]|jgi:SAM-dependent methyltransferase
MSKQEILTVAPLGWEGDSLAGFGHQHLAFRFVEESPQDGLSAWLSETTEEAQIVDVASHCHSYEGGFSQHALNRVFSQSLLRLRPKVVVVVGLVGCTVDLLRVAELMGIPALLILERPVQPLSDLEMATQCWLRSSLDSCDGRIFAEDPSDHSWPTAWLPQDTVTPLANLQSSLNDLLQLPRVDLDQDYSMYDFCQRDHTLLVRMQKGDTRHFQGCSTVLDLACGVGIFLDCLRQSGIKAVGVERDVRLAKYATGMGLDVLPEDVINCLQNTDSQFDGIYCSHFVEHLPVEAVQKMLQLAASRLSAGGVLVLVFPDPESIRSQLLGFWRDPEHVRFYHPELIAGMAASVGLDLEWSSYDEQPHTAVPFEEVPPPMPVSTPFPEFQAEANMRSPGVIASLLEKFGLVSAQRLVELETRLADWSQSLESSALQAKEAQRHLEERTTKLWEVNRTWAWNDNATLRLRKRAE